MFLNVSRLFVGNCIVFLFFLVEKYTIGLQKFDRDKGDSVIPNIFCDK